MKPRKVLFWIHLSAGVLAGIVILIMSVTGIMLAYERQVLNWSVRSYRSVPPTPDAPRLSADLLIAKTREYFPNPEPTIVTVLSDPSAPVSVRLGRDRTVYLDAYTGAVLGEGSRKLQSFFQSAENWHRWLAVAGERRAAGRRVTGWANLLFTILVCSGPFLWWPKMWTLPNLRKIAMFKAGLSGKARNFNWHNTIGSWCAIPLSVIVLSGVVMSFPWANDMLYRLTGSPALPRQPVEAAANRPARSEAGRDRPAHAVEAANVSLDPLLLRAEQQVAGWRSISLRIPSPRESNAVFMIDQGDGGRPDQRATLTMNAKTGDVVRWEPFSSYNRGRQLRAWARFSHTGEAGGIPGETVALLASLGAVFLVWTGLSLALRRIVSLFADGGFADGGRKRNEFQPVVTGGATSSVQSWTASKKESTSF